MFKEVVISIIIIISIISLDLITQNYAKESIDQTSTMLSDLKEKIKEEEDQINSSLEKVTSQWDSKRTKLAYFIEHDELEKVDTNLTNVNSYIEVGDLDMAINSIDEAKYILQHIKQKNTFALENIF